MSCRRGSGNHLTLYAEATLTRQVSTWAAVGTGEDNTSMTYQRTRTRWVQAFIYNSEKTEHRPEEKLCFRCLLMLNAQMSDQAGVRGRRGSS